MRTIAIVNQKGGVAKTTTALNLGAEIARKGYKVLLIDLDAQYSATSAVFGKKEFDYTIYDVMVKKMDIKDVIQKAEHFGFDLVPSDIMLSAVDLTLAQKIGREKVLLRQTQSLSYDMIIMDCPPSLGLITVNALTACKEIIIPVCPAYFSLRGIRLLEDVLIEMEENLSIEHLSKKILITRYRERVVTMEAEKAIKNRFGSSVFKTMIPENIKIEEAHSAHLSVYKYDATCKGSIAYKNLSKEVINGKRKGQKPALKRHRKGSGKRSQSSFPKKGAG